MPLNAGSSLSLPVEHRVLVTDDRGARVWRRSRSELTLPAEQAALVICDVWDRHWSAGAARRVDELAPRIDSWCRQLRDAGVLIVHAPSDTMDAYRESPARLRVAGGERAPAPEPMKRPPLPFEAIEGGSDTDDPFPQDTGVWTREHPAIAIDPASDVITDDGGELVGYLRAQARDTVLMVGVHTNMCILNRSFGLVALVGHGLTPVLVADLTDAMYDPADPPYVDHDAGTQLVIGYIEAFVAPTTRSEEVVVTTPSAP